MVRSRDKRGVIVGKSRDGLVAYVHWDGNKIRDNGIALSFLELENTAVAFEEDHTQE